MGNWKELMERLKKLLPYAPLIPAIVLAVCIAVSLSGYSIPVYAVEQPEETAEETAETVEADEDGEEEEEEEEETEKGSFDLEDGVYEGTATGFAGDITVEVTIKDKQITAIEVIYVEADDDAFFSKAEAVIDDIIEKQSTDVDTITGATYSSRGIINAVINALTGEEDDSETAADSTTGAGSTSVSTVDESGEWADGTYYGSGTGFGGTLTVKVVISGGAITSIDITDHSETASYLSKAMTLIDTIIAKQSTNVDTISGATYSSVGIIEAVRDALSQAETSGTSSSSTSSSDTDEGESGQFPYEDGVYYGTAYGFQSYITTAVVIEDETITTILITDQDETEAYFNRAKTVADNIVTAQSTSVDTISGATYSSKGIISAVKAALKNAKNGLTGLESSEDDSTTVAQGTSGNFDYDDGVYYGTAEGYQSDITVAVMIKDKTIKGIVVTEQDETESFWEKAVVVADTIETAQSTSVDTITGATYSSKGIINAVKAALKSASKSSSNGSSSSSSDGDDDSGSDDDDDDTSEAEGTSYTVTVTCYPDEDEEFDEYTVTFVVTLNDGKITNVTCDTSTISDQQKKNISCTNKAVTAVVSELGSSGLTYASLSAKDGADVVSGATCSFNAIVDACEKAIAQSTGSSDSSDDTDTSDTTDSSDADTSDTTDSSDADTSDTTDSSDADTSDTTDSSDTDTSDTADSTDTNSSDTTADDTSEDDSTDDTATDDSTSTAKTYSISVLCSPDEDEDFEAYSLSMNVTVENSLITAVTNVAGDGDSGNDKYIAWAVSGRTKSGTTYTGVVDQILASGTTDNIDVVSGATCSSNAIISGCSQALSEAASAS